MGLRYFHFFMVFLCEVRNLDLAAPAPQMSLDRALPKSLPGQVGSELPLNNGHSLCPLVSREKLGDWPHS